jgi:hypothetical protein
VTRRDTLTEPVVAVGEGLLEVLAEVPDPRDRRGRRHSLVSLLAIAIAAVQAGARSWTAIGEIASDLTAQQLVRLGVWPSPYTGRYSAPDEATIRRALQRLDPAPLERLVGGWFQAKTGQGPAAATDGGSPAPTPSPERPPRPSAVAVDGKTLRGSAGQGRPVHLLGALDHDAGTVLAQRRVDDKSNEVTGFRPLLEEVDLAGRVVTADAMHCQREHARWLVDRAGADYLLVAKDNQPRLVQAISRTPEGSFSPCAHHR